ncbi:MAG: hypothetical protein BWY82_00976 [Verrucomicrobia bacterium ADurb.Bin474]|nr:MAG: hypothetical protein BWY82_00976 [Verrucomicrobia bacterium ADurb.Bin474]
MNVVAHVEHLTDKIRRHLERFHKCHTIRVAHIPEAPQIQRDHRTDEYLGCECLGRSNADFRPGVLIHASIHFPCNGGPNDVGDRHYLESLALGLPKRCQRVDGFSGLADHHNQRVLVQRRVAIPELGGILHFHRDARVLLDQVFSDQTRMPSRATCTEQDAVDLPQLVRINVETAKPRGAAVIRKPPTHRVLKRGRLLENLLFHVMPEISKFVFLQANLDLMHHRLDGFIIRGDHPVASV